MTESLHQCKPSFSVKKVLLRFTKDAQWKTSAKKATVIFATDPIEYAFVGVSILDDTFMGGEYSN